MLDNEEWEAKSAGFGECLGVRERWRIEDEASQGIEWDDAEDGAFQTRRRDALRNARAYVQDGSEYRAELFTAPDFFLRASLGGIGQCRTSPKMSGCVGARCAPISL